MFKIGDKVRCIDDGGYSYIKKGEIYTVISIFGEGGIFLDTGYSYQIQYFENVEQIKKIDYLQIAKDVCGV